MQGKVPPQESPVDAITDTPPDCEDWTPEESRLEIGRDRLD